MDLKVKKLLHFILEGFITGPPRYARIHVTGGMFHVISRFHDRRHYQDLEGARETYLKMKKAPKVCAQMNPVMSYIEEHDENPKPFIWKKTADQIIEKVGRARLALDNAPSG